MKLLSVREHRGISLSNVGIGTWAIGGPYWTGGEPTGWGGPLDDEESLEALKVGLDAGLTHIDTADVYGYGRSERIIGELSSASKSNATIASKVGFAHTTSPSVYSPENIRFQCEQSLRNLGVPHIPVYYIHHCDFGELDEFLDDAIGELHQLQTDGLIGEIGLSGYSARDLMRVADKLKPSFIQSWASMEHPEFIDPRGELAAYMEGHNIKFVAMMPFGQGRLLGKYSPANVPRFESGDNRLDNPEFTQESLAEFETRIEAIKGRFGNSPRELIVPALGFILAHPTVISVVPGYRNLQQMKDLIWAVQQNIDDSDVEFLRSIFPFDGGSSHPWAE